ncbi:hypothetical protein GOV14_01775 [Candidatus Pacearchaeota archaeon]|nr:hypothetical protein [Candidatus Pacearchaeota archaeon]
MTENLDVVQPVDGYVLGLLRRAKETYDLDIDLENPTRGQRLDAALVMEHESDGFSSMEIMLGKRVSSFSPEDEDFKFLKMANSLNGNPNPRTFYGGFAHSYWPDKKTSL